MEDRAPDRQTAQQPAQEGAEGKRQGDGQGELSSAFLAACFFTRAASGRALSTAPAGARPSAPPQRLLLLRARAFPLGADGTVPLSVSHFRLLPPLARSFTSFRILLLHCFSLRRHTQRAQGETLAAQAGRNGIPLQVGLCMDKAETRSQPTFSCFTFSLRRNPQDKQDTSGTGHAHTSRQIQTDTHTHTYHTAALKRKRPAACGREKREREPASERASSASPASAAALCRGREASALHDALGKLRGAPAEDCSGHDGARSRLCLAVSLLTLSVPGRERAAPK